MGEDNINDHIESYLSGGMSHEEAMVFEKMLRENPDLEKERKLHESVIQYLTNNSEYLGNVDNDYTKKLRAFLRSHEAQEIKNNLELSHKTYTLRNKETRKRKGMLFAASFLLFLASSVIIWFYANYKKESVDELFDQYYERTDLPALVERNEKNSSLNKIVELFDLGNYKKTIQEFEKYEENTQSLDTLLFLYKGMAYLELSEVDRALKAFDLVSKSELIDSPKGQWFTALVYLKNGDKNNAAKTLDSLFTDSSKYKNKEIKELLEIIR